MNDIAQNTGFGLGEETEAEEAADTAAAAGVDTMITVRRCTRVLVTVRQDPETPNFMTLGVNGKVLSILKNKRVSIPIAYFCVLENAIQKRYTKVTVTLDGEEENDFEGSDFPAIPYQVHDRTFKELTIPASEYLRGIDELVAGELPNSTIDA